MWKLHMIGLCHRASTTGLVVKDSDSKMPFSHKNNTARPVYWRRRSLLKRAISLAPRCRGPGAWISSICTSCGSRGSEPATSATRPESYPDKGGGHTD